MADTFRIPYKLADIDTAPAPLRLFYSKGDDGSYTLNLESHPNSAKLAEFRTNNRGLHERATELESRLKQYEGIDPAEHAAMKARLQAFDGIDAEQARTALAAASEKTKAEEELTRERAAHSATRLQHLVSAEFFALGGRREAAEFIAQKAAGVFTMTPAGEITSDRFSPNDPSARLSLSEWLNAQLRESAFAFQPSRGGGAQSNPSSAPGGRAAKVVSSDPLEFGKHIEAIARGEAVVR